jgi:IS30 family transposase
VHTGEDLAAVAAELNDRPRKTLGWISPAELLEALRHEDVEAAGRPLRG